jgi:hypothetical protein
MRFYARRFFGDAATEQSSRNYGASIRKYDGHTYRCDPGYFPLRDIVRRQSAGFFLVDVHCAGGGSHRQVDELRPPRKAREPSRTADDGGGTVRTARQKQGRIVRIAARGINGLIGRGSWIRTNDLQYPKLPRYQAALYPDNPRKRQETSGYTLQAAPARRKLPP